MNLPHLATDIEKIQSGVSRMNARLIARRCLEPHVESAALDADLLVAFVCGLPRYELLLASDALLNASEAELARALLERRAKGEPIAYIIGSKEFYGLDFKVSPSVLIPRPDTEILVEAAIDLLRNVPNPHVIDVCTGSGCIAIAIADQVKAAQVTAIDLSEEAVAVATENASRLGVGDRVEVLQGDLLSSYSGPMADMIVANPPYIPSREMPGLMRDVRDFEPHLALQGEGEDGLGLHCKILEQSLNILKPGGVLLMELGAGQAEFLSNKISFGFAPVEFLKDYGGIWRVAKFVRLGMNHG